MKSLIPAALVVVLEAGFLFSIASLPSPAAHLGAELQVARAAPAERAPAPAAAHAGPRASRS